MTRWLCLLLVSLLVCAPAWGEGQWHVSAYTAKNSPDRFAEILREMEAAPRRSYIDAVTLARVHPEGRWFRWESEAQLVKHRGMQDHWEANAVIVARWMRFPWDRWLDTRFAVGEGLSYASEVPPLEPRADPEEGDSARLLNYVYLELEFVAPGAPRWSGYTRIHHRSGVAGLFGGVRGGSNFIGLGVRYTFD